MLIILKLLMHIVEILLVGFIDALNIILIAASKSSFCESIVRDEESETWEKEYECILRGI